MADRNSEWFDHDHHHYEYHQKRWQLVNDAEKTRRMPVAVLGEGLEPASHHDMKTDKDDHKRKLEVDPSLAPIDRTRRCQEQTRTAHGQRQHRMHDSPVK